MVSFVNPEDSEKEHEMLREIEEEIFTELGISFQRIDICT
jgi:seryl-tRNA synthetase